MLNIFGNRYTFVKEARAENEIEYSLNRDTYHIKYYKSLQLEIGIVGEMAKGLDMTKGWLSIVIMNYRLRINMKRPTKCQLVIERDNQMPLT